MDLKKMCKRFWTLDVHNHAGFTLVELIVVIAILAILAGVAVPVYSGYINRANRVADEQLLANINQAFISACMLKGENNFNRTDVVGGINANGEFVLSEPEAIAEAFLTFYEGGKFKTIKAVRYDKLLGCFVEIDGDLASLAASLKEKFGAAIAEKILGTALGAIGTENLFDQMNNAMDMAGELNLHTLTGAPFLEAYFNYIGFDADADYEDEDAKQAAFEARLESLGLDYETSMTNAIALYAAENSAGLTIDNLSQWLGGDTTTEDLQNNANANTLAEAAAIYGLYLSYYKETNGTAPTDPTLDVMTDALTDEAFAIWVKDSNGTAQSELDAYKTYMGIVNEAAKDESARDEILANGFTNPELENLMKDLIGS